MTVVLPGPVIVLGLLGLVVILGTLAVIALLSVRGIERGGRRRSSSSD